jgi:DNA-binding transcriptional regulator YiaG
MKAINTSKTALKLSQREWSKHLGVNHSTLCRWLRSAGIQTVRRKKTPGVTLLEILAAKGIWL